MQLLNSIIHEIAHFLKLNSDDYCDLISTFHDDTLVFNDGSMASILRFNGFFSALSSDELQNMMDFMANSLSEIFIKRGYTIIFKFHRGLADNESLKRIIERKKATARRLDFDLDDMLDEQYSQFVDTVFDENIYITLITSPIALDKLDREMNTTSERYAKKPSGAMDIFAGQENIYGKHCAFVEQVLNSLLHDQFYASVEKLNIIESLRAIYGQIHLDSKLASEWLPDLVNTEYNNVLIPSTGDKGDISHFLPRTLGSQLLGCGFQVPQFAGLPSSTQVIGKHLVVSTNMETAPKKPAPFNDLFAMLNKVMAVDDDGLMANIPYSISFILQSQSTMGVKQFLGEFLSSIGEHNATIYNSIKELSRQSSQIPIVSFQFTASTWASNSEQGAVAIKERFLRLATAIESWGGISLSHSSADDIKVWRNNISGLSNQFTGNKALIPLNYAFGLMPIHRPLSPFIKNGSILYRSVDGKLMPFELLSSFSHDHQICVTGSMGSGKSVMLSNLIFEYVMNPKNQDMPKILMIDVGFSGAGMFDLFKNALPPQKRHLVAKKVLENTKDNAINPFDFKRGLLYPLPSESSLTKAFLMNLLTPRSRTQGIDGLDTAITDIYDYTIRKYMGNDSDSTPKLYSVGQNQELDNLLIELHPFDFETTERILPTGQKEQMIIGASLPKNLILKGLSDTLHQLSTMDGIDSVTIDKYTRASSLAWRLAMPNLEDLLRCAGNERFGQLYSQRTDTGDILSERIQGLIRDAIINYPCFAYNTVFDVDTANLLLLDLGQVIDTNNPHKTGLFYQLCFFLFSRYFKFDDGHLDKYVPDHYQEYYTKWNKTIQSIPKIMVIDEFKNLQSSPNAMIGVEKSALEFRKHGMTIIYSGQLPRQFVVNDPRNVGTKINLLNLMSYHIELSVPTDYDKELLAESYSINNEVISEMSKIRRTKELGSVFYMYMKSANNKKVHQFINNRIGHKMLWVCSTTPIDRTIRGVMLNKASNQREAINALAFYFGDSARDMLETELNRINQLRISENEKKKLTDNLFDDKAQTALQLWREYQAKLRLDEQVMIQERIAIRDKAIQNQENTD